MTPAASTVSSDSRVQETQNLTRSAHENFSSDTLLICGQLSLPRGVSSPFASRACTVKSPKPLPSLCLLNLEHQKGSNLQKSKRKNKKKEKKSTAWDLDQGGDKLRSQPSMEQTANSEHDWQRWPWAVHPFFLTGVKTTSRCLRKKSNKPQSECCDVSAPQRFSPKKHYRGHG